MEDDIVLNDIIQYTNENYIQDCCSNPYHTSMKRMHGSLTLNSIPSATFDPDSADPQTQRFLSPIYISSFINQLFLDKDMKQVMSVIICIRGFIVLFLIIYF